MESIVYSLEFQLLTGTASRPPHATSSLTTEGISNRIDVTFNEGGRDARGPSKSRPRSWLTFTPASSASDSWDLWYSRRILGPICARTNRPAPFASIMVAAQIASRGIH